MDKKYSNHSIENPVKDPMPTHGNAVWCILVERIYGRLLLQSNSEYRFKHGF